MIDIVIDLYVFLLFLLISSFYNVVAIRSLKNESFAKGRSYCPICKRTLSWYELIPVISYVAQKGKCRGCRTKISPLYPIGEIFITFTFYTLYLFIGFDWELLVMFFVFTALTLGVLTDIREKVILDRITFPMLAIVLALRVFIGESSFWYYFLSGLGIFLFFLLLSLVFKGGFGGGDIKLYALVGVAIGGYDTILAIFYGSLLSIIWAIPKVKKHGRKFEIPFAPFIYVGVFITVLYRFSPF